MAEHQLPKLVTGVRFPSPAWRRPPFYLRDVGSPVSESCPCGLVVLTSADLDELGLCVVCAGSGHEWECACVECGSYRDGSDRGLEPTEALAEALRSAATPGGAESR